MKNVCAIMFVLVGLGILLMLQLACMSNYGNDKICSIRARDFGENAQQVQNFGVGDTPAVFFSGPSVQGKHVTVTLRKNGRYCISNSMYVVSGNYYGMISFTSLAQGTYVAYVTVGGVVIKTVTFNVWR